METFTPTNDLEINLLRARENAIQIEIFIQNLINSSLPLPSAGRVSDDGSGFRPIIYEKMASKCWAHSPIKVELGN
ncbi:hypothetical protein [Massilia sp. DWR3-1-1]|uniref:hypothetical protein n=1 Tax=Massilia sp. DWR3-1-1 TaxID=2804559 RepID=UPI003CF4304B